MQFVVELYECRPRVLESLIEYCYSDYLTLELDNEELKQLAQVAQR